MVRRTVSSDRNSNSPNLGERQAGPVLQNRAQGISSATVNTLMVENKGDLPVYIQAGDIVKGGKQDRTIGVDIVIVPHSGNVPLAAFCVEAGRWSYRSPSAGSGRFISSTQCLSSKGLKLAVRHSKDQGAVWENVN